MNVFNKSEIANSYDVYYQTDFGKIIDKIEKGVISDLIKDLSRNHMLELGCGTGHWTEYFIHQGFEVTGIDISEPMLKLAREKGMNAKFINADSINLPFKNESFEVISSLTMLEFVDNKDKVLQEIYRILKPKGFLIIGCLNANSVLGKRKDQDEIFKEAHFYTPDELTFKLNLFGIPKLKYGVHLMPDFSILDGTNEAKNVDPAFIAAIVQKK